MRKPPANFLPQPPASPQRQAAHLYLSFNTVRLSSVFVYFVLFASVSIAVTLTNRNGSFELARLSFGGSIKLTNESTNVAERGVSVSRVDWVGELFR
jgi:hypothetical protein